MSKKIYCYSLLSFVILIIVGSVGVYIAVVHILPYSPIRPYRITRDDVHRMFVRGSTPSDFDLNYKTLDVLVEDTLHLKGWFICAQSDKSQGTIVLLHGIGSCKESLLPLADTLAHHGFNSVIYDLRAHGESDGVNCTFGYYEKNDVVAVINYVQKNIGNSAPYAVLGHSLGAAVAVQAMAIDSCIACGIAVSTFANLRETLHDYWRQISGIPFTLIPDIALRNSEQIASFTVDSVHPESDSRSIYRPMMIIHGTADKKISIDYGKRVYANLQSPEKKWYPLEGAGHDNLDVIGGSKYYETIVIFFLHHLHHK